MKEGIVARRYAKAFFALALDAGDVAGFGQDLGRIISAARVEKHLVPALSDGNVARERRIAALGNLAPVLALKPLTLSFLKVLVRKDRIALLPLIAESYRRMQLESERIASAQLTVADEAIVNEAADRIRHILESLLGRRAICDVAVDPALIGGFVVRVGDTVFDASVKGRLRKMKDELLVH